MPSLFQKAVAAVLVGSLATMAHAKPKPKPKPRPENHGFCEKTAAAVTAAGAAVAGAGTAASTAGIASVAHSSGAAILTSVGVGGTGYIAGTLGGAGATALGFVSSPVVVGAAALAAVGGGGTLAYCHFKKKP